MFKLRLAKKGDVAKILELSKSATYGMTNIPKTIEEIERKISASNLAVEEFEKLSKSKVNLNADTNTSDAKILDHNMAGATGYSFLFVLEEDDGTVSGISAIYTNIGHDRPFYTYRISNLDSLSPELDIRIEHKTLNLVNDYHGASELGSLLLHPDYRGNGRGKLLSYGRMMLIAQNHKLFGQEIMAEMLGKMNKNGESPFWLALGSNFFKLAFNDADIQSSKDNHFIADLMPKFPIYICLLPKDAIETIGQTHTNTVPARKMLEKQSFRFKANIDIFDAGPCLEATTSEIPLVKNTKKTILSELPKAEPQTFFVTTSGFDGFTACYNTLDEKKLIEQLSVKSNDKIHYAKIKP